MRRTHDLYWLAGFLEGEGSFSIVKGKGIDRYYIQMSASSTDYDIICDVLAVAGVGHMRGPYKYGSNKLPYWMWYAGEQMDVAGLIMTLYPLMGERRRERIREQLGVWRNNPFISRRKKVLI